MIIVSTQTVGQVSVYSAQVVAPSSPPQVFFCWLSLAAVALFAAVWWFFRDFGRITGIHEKHVLVTGCDSGFGNLVARQLDQRGFRVIAACLTEPGASRLRAKASTRLITLLLDVTDSASIKRAVERVRTETGERGETGDR